MSFCDSSPRVFRRFLAVFALVALTSCVDGPATPDEIANPNFAPQLAIAPVFSLVGPSGVEVQSVGQQDALGEAFKLVNKFRVVVRRASNNEVVVTRW